MEAASPSHIVAEVEFPRRLSPEWMRLYAKGRVGCSEVQGSYTWRHVGLGSNINSKFAPRLSGGNNVRVVPFIEPGASVTHGERGWLEELTL